MRVRGRLAIRPRLGTALAVQDLEDRRLLSGIEGGLGPGHSLPAGHTELGIISPHNLPRQDSGPLSRLADAHAPALVPGADDLSLRSNPSDRPMAGELTRPAGTSTIGLDESHDRTTLSDLGESAAIPIELLGVLRIEPRSSDAMAPRVSAVVRPVEHWSDALSSTADHTPGADELVAVRSERRAPEDAPHTGDPGPRGAAAGGFRTAALRSAALGETSGAEQLVDAAGPGQEPAASPRSSELLTDFLPFDRARLSEAIDRFLAEFEDLGTELAGWRSPSGVLPALAGVALATVASEVAWRRCRGGRPAATSEEEDEGWTPSPGFPGAWSFAES
ncbi:MAG TPA: hypothetical protein VFF52_26180 [Isosphaeraceae bacterium]|nr:hypothetical protein [Isosphaeraceae bacterium]